MPAQGLTLDEFQQELAERFAEKIEGIEVMPVLTTRAPRYVYVLGEVKLPGRYTLDAPTTVMQALAMAGSWNNGANINADRGLSPRRRLAVDRHGARPAGRLAGPPTLPGQRDLGQRRRPDHRAQERLLRTDNFIELIFTRGLYGVIPFSVSQTNLTTLTH